MCASFLQFSGKMKLNIDFIRNQAFCQFIYFLLTIWFKIKTFFNIVAWSSICGNFGKHIKEQTGCESVLLKIQK